jgi:hypothetical protein
MFKARIVEPTETTVARKRLWKHAPCLAMAQLASRDSSQVYVHNNRRTVEAVFSVRSVPRLYNEDQVSLLEENAGEGQEQIYYTELKQFRWLRQMTDPTSRQRGRPISTKQWLSNSN